MTEFRTDRTISSYRKMLAVLAYLRVLFLHLEMPEQVRMAQGPGKYCRKESVWILSIWNGEIPSIIGLSLVFSVENACAAI